VKPTGVSAIYDEWYGTGHFKDVPIEGGIAHLETGEFRKTWRRSFRTAENKRFSRFSMVIKGIGNHMQRTGKTLEETLAEQDTYYGTHKSINKTIKLLQENGDLVAVARKH
jgi:3-hydroxymyristoyl/3-hydroxydecanoyl-(acyl carrier protein) dehydratase